MIYANQQIKPSIEIGFSNQIGDSETMTIIAVQLSALLALYKYLLFKELVLYITKSISSHAARQNFVLFLLKFSAILQFMICLNTI